MAKAVIAAVVILALIVTASWISMYYTKKVSVEFTERIDKAGTDPKALKSIADDWETQKIPLMFIINHRDIENISLSLIRACYEAEAGRSHMAKQETEITKFLLEELVERERLTPENIL